jgi:hypothetical protein
MGKIRGTFWLSFLLIVLILITFNSSIWYRAHDPIWARMRESRLNYDVISVFLSLWSLAVAYGLWRKQEWARMFGISLFAFVFFILIGVPLLAPLLTSGSVPITLRWPALSIGAMCIACIVLLSRQSFRDIDRQ